MSCAESHSRAAKSRSEGHAPVHPCADTLVHCAPTRVPINIAPTCRCQHAHAPTAPSYTNTFMYPYINTLVYRHLCIPTPSYTDALVHQHPRAPARSHPNVLMHQHTHAPTPSYTNTTPSYTDTFVYRHTCAPNQRPRILTLLCTDTLVPQ